MSDHSAAQPTPPASFVDKVAWVHVVDRRLLAARSAGRALFYLPGGKRETGESDVETLAREIEEELSVTVDASTAALVGTFEAPADGRTDGRVVRLTCFSASYAGDLAPSREVAEIAWLTSGDLDRVSAANRLVIEHLHEADLLD